MIKKLIYIGVLFISPMVSASETAAGYATGNDILKYCKAVVHISDKPNTASSYDYSIDEASEVVANANYCIGMIDGIVSSNFVLELTDRKKSFCMPSGVTPLQAARVIIKELERIPEDLHIGGGMLAITVLKKAFPCNN